MATGSCWQLAKAVAAHINAQTYALPVIAKVDLLPELDPQVAGMQASVVPGDESAEMSSRNEETVTRGVTLVIGKAISKEGTAFDTEGRECLEVIEEIRNSLRGKSLRITATGLVYSYVSSEQPLLFMDQVLTQAGMYATEIGLQYVTTEDVQSAIVGVNVT